MSVRISIRALAITCLTLLVFTFSYAEEAQEKRLLSYYYTNYCDSCTPETDFLIEFENLTGDNAESYSCNFYNIATEFGKDALALACTQYGLDESLTRTQLLIVDGQVYDGYASIRTDLPRYVIEKTNDVDSTLYYFYVTPCESCEAVKRYIDALPDTARVTLGDYSFDSKVSVLRININESPALALALFDAYQVPESNRFAPIILAGDEYAKGEDAIRLFTQQRLYKGAALNTRIITEGELLPYLRFGATMLAGLIGGLNPCALSMLLLFLSLIGQSASGAGKHATAFLTAKFIAYLAIGSFLFGALASLDIGWLPLAIKFVLISLCGALFALNILDAIRLSRGDYGRVVNQLPTSLRARLRKRMDCLLRGGSSVAVCFIVGIFVAAGEFLCAGQVYLATLLAILREGGTNTREFILLTVYCASFILPAIITSLIVVKGNNLIRTTAFFSRHMVLIKLLTAAFFLLTILFSIIL